MLDGQHEIVTLPGLISACAFSDRYASCTLPAKPAVTRPSTQLQRTADLHIQVALFMSIASASGGSDCEWREAARVIRFRNKARVCSRRRAVTAGKPVAASDSWDPTRAREARADCTQARPLPIRTPPGAPPSRAAGTQPTMRARRRFALRCGNPPG